MGRIIKQGGFWVLYRPGFSGLQVVGRYTLKETAIRNARKLGIKVLIGQSPEDTSRGKVVGQTTPQDLLAQMLVWWAVQLSARR